MLTTVESGCDLDFFCAIDRECLLSLLSGVQAIVNRKGSAATMLPVLNNVMLSVRGGRVTVAGTNIDLSAVSRAPCSDGPGDVVVMGFMLFDIIRKLSPGCSVALKKSRSDDFVQVIGGKSEFKLPTMDPSRFPQIDHEYSDMGARLSCEACFQLFDRVAFAISLDEARQFLCGARVSLEDDNMLCAVATNGHRLSLMRVKAEVVSEGFKPFILPRRTVTEVMRHAYTSPKDSLMVDLQGNRAIFRFQNTTLVSKVIDGHYPDVSRIIPNRDAQAFIVDTQDFLEVLERVTAVLLNKSSAVSLELSADKMRVSAQALEYGSSAYEDIEIKYEGPKLIVSLNSKYLMEIVAKCSGDKFICHVRSADDPLLCLDNKNPEFLFVIMPIRA